MILGIIPARGGSEAIPRKNIKNLLGHPLIWWTIQAAKESKLLDRFVVSTEDDEIASLANGFGADVLRRPAHLATADVTVTRVVQHVLEHIKADIIVLLLVTSPVRINNIIDKAVARFLKKEVDSLAIGYMFKYDEWGTAPEVPRQKKKGYFVADGCVLIHKVDVMLSGNWYGKIVERMIVPHFYNFDIDDKADLWAVEGILNNLKECDNDKLKG